MNQPTLPFRELVYVDVSPNFMDIPRSELVCLRCGGAFKPGPQRNKMGQYMQCAVCAATYYARGGQFIGHGEDRRERWCAVCEAWRPAGFAGCVEEIGACYVCETGFDGDVPMPPEYEVLKARAAEAARQSDLQADHGDN